MFSALLVSACFSSSAHCVCADAVALSRDRRRDDRPPLCYAAPVCL